MDHNIKSSLKEVDFKYIEQTEQAQEARWLPFGRMLDKPSIIKRVEQLNVC
jgi:hypothetical protein